MQSLGDVLIDVWRQVLVDGRRTVNLPDGIHMVSRTRNQGLKTVYFGYRNCRIEGIEQNPLTSSEWAKRASQGERIMQFSSQGRYFASVAEGQLTRYPEWQRQGLPE